MPSSVARANVEVERRRRARQAIASLWTPLPGPQVLLRESAAFETYFGGSAGGGKTDAILGEAATNHRQSLILRRQFTDLTAIEDRALEIIGRHGKFNGNKHRWRLNDGRIIEFGACQYDRDKGKWQGRPHDLKAFDELAQFSYAIYRFVIGWTRTTVPAQRTRVLGAGNPPTDAEGRWVIQHWAPWLDPQHPKPAAVGELRWFAVLDGKDVEVDGPQSFAHKGETIEPRSRTFIPAKLEDNPHLAKTGYRATLQNLPEPLRSQMLMGDFSAGLKDDAWQVIPTEWVRAAQARWHEDGYPLHTDGRPLRMTRVGVDVARGGDDQTVLAPRFGEWFARLRKFPGTATPDGPAVAGLILQALTAGGNAIVDVIGVGAAAYDVARQQGAAVSAFVSSESSDHTDRSGVLSFVNKRAAAWWEFREALDPRSDYQIALPPENELLADLTAPRWLMRPGGVLVESKQDIAKRIGRSTDCGDAVVMAWQAPVDLSELNVSTAASTGRRPGHSMRW